MVSLEIYIFNSIKKKGSFGAMSEFYKPLLDVYFLQEHSPQKISCHDPSLLPGLVEEEGTKTLSNTLFTN